MSSNDAPFTHSYYFSEDGDRLDSFWSEEKDLLTAMQTLILQIDGQSHTFFATVGRNEGQPVNKFVEIVVSYNGSSTNLTVTHENGEGERSRSITFGDDLKASAKTNIELPKWTDWYNDSEVIIEIEARDSDGLWHKVTSGIHFEAKSWKSKLMRGDEDFLGETEWLWDNSDWLTGSNSTNVTTWTHEVRDVSEISKYLKDFGVTVNDTVSLDVLIDVISHWKYQMSISAYDIST